MSEAVKQRYGNGYFITQAYDRGVDRLVDVITCTRCGSVSFNVNDVAQRYCGRCHVFHENCR